MFKFKNIPPQVWAFDCEWVPDPKAGRLLYHLAEECSDQQAMEEMWKRGGATEVDPQPFLKTAICRVVSISAFVRKIKKDGSIVVALTSLPHDVADATQTSEAHIIEKFLSQVGNHKNELQLVGFNSVGADLRILVQRGLINGISVPAFCERPDKPWEGADFFARESDYHIDLWQSLSGAGKSSPSLNEMATLSGIPGKMGVSGEQVPRLWLEKRYKEIVDYNECDALTTYLLWLRAMFFCGYFTPEDYEQEQLLVLQFLNGNSTLENKNHLSEYIAEWARLQHATHSDFSKFL